MQLPAGRLWGCKFRAPSVTRTVQKVCSNPDNFGCFICLLREPVVFQKQVRGAVFKNVLRGHLLEVTVIGSYKRRRTEVGLEEGRGQQDREGKAESGWLLRRQTQAARQPRSRGPAVSIPQLLWSPD